MRHTILVGDVRERIAEIPDGSVQCVVTSPPYFGLRDYNVDGQIGLEPTLAEYIASLVGVFREVRRVLRDDGTLWMNIGDSYCSHDPGGRRAGEFLNPGGRQSEESRGARNKAGTFARGQYGLKAKDLMMAPARVAIALQEDGWYLRSDIIWAKPNPMPESVTDRPTSAHEHVFLLSKSKSYYYDADAIREEYQNVQSGAAATFERNGSKRAHVIPGQSVGTHRPNRRDDVYGHGGRNKRNVWTVSTAPYKGAHFATFPPKLVEPMILAGCPEGGMVLDPFGGAGTVSAVCDGHGRDSTLIELNPEYAEMARRRICAKGVMFTEVTVR